MNRRQQILILCIFFAIGIVAIVAGIVIYMHAGTPKVITTAGQIQGTTLEQRTPYENTMTPIPGYVLSLSAVDLATGEPLGSASVYLDGGYEGSTSVTRPVGILNISRVSGGLHTLRVTKPGYSDYAQSVIIPSASPVKIGLKAQQLVPVRESGSHKTKIDVVFVPSGTTYNCAEQKKIFTTGYVTDRSAFVSDVHRFVNESLFTLDSVTDKTDPIPADYRDRLNIYYYYDSSEFADAFSGCAGTVPENVWKTVPFADVVIILYPTYYTLNTGTPCEPNGCVSPGTGRKWMKIPADQAVLFLHESGHAIFGLVDTYCDNTIYWQNDPEPNVWSSPERCVKDTTDNSWSSSGCQQIRQANSAACTKQFWRWDPDPDIMREGYFGTFGKASTRRITYTLNNVDSWGIAP